jgi:hypothetical protein
VSAPRAAIEIQSFACLIPAGTLQSAPITVSMAMPVRQVLGLTIRVPPGPNGFMGFAIGMSSKNVIPQNNGAFIVTSDEVIDWDLDESLNSGAWQLIGYNTGVYDHTVYVRFRVILPPPQTTVGAANPIPADLLGQAADLTTSATPADVTATSDGG